MKRATDATRSLAKAQGWLDECQAMDPNRTPIGVAVSAYFAMFHAARAALVRNALSSAKTASGISRRFGHVAKYRSVELRRAAENLRKMQALRISGDYEGKASTAEADDARRAAIEFLDICDREFRGSDGTRNG